MSNARTLKAHARTEDFGSAGSRRVVRSGRIPAVIYGKNQPLHITVDAAEFEKLLRNVSETTIVTVDVDGDSHDVLLKTFQENLLLGKILHIDFYEIVRGQALRTRIYIKLEGNPIGVKDGGVMDQVLRDVEIECLPKDLPEELVLDVSKLGVNESLSVSDIPVPAEVKVLEDPEATVVTIKMVREEPEQTAEAAEGEAAPAAAADQKAE